MSTTVEKASSKKPMEETKGRSAPPLASVTAFSGPIPHPDILRQYDLLLPGAAKKFLEAPHLEAEHRRSLEKALIHERMRMSKRGQWMAFFLATLSITASFASIFLGYDIAGLAALFIAIASFIGVFIYAKKQSN